jgi:hypothetical protein
VEASGRREPARRAAGGAALGCGLSWCYCNSVKFFKQRHTAGRIAWSHTNSVTTNWGRVMTISSLLSSEPIQGHFAAMEITDADFDRIEIIGDLIRHIEIVDDERRQHER